MSRSAVTLFLAKLTVIFGAIFLIGTTPITSVSVAVDGAGQNWSTPSTDDGNPWDGSTDGNPWDG